MIRSILTVSLFFISSYANAANYQGYIVAIKSIDSSNFLFFEVNNPEDEKCGGYSLFKVEKNEQKNLSTAYFVSQAWINNSYVNVFIEGSSSCFNDSAGLARTVTVGKSIFEKKQKLIRLLRDKKKSKE